MISKKLWHISSRICLLLYPHFKTRALPFIVFTHLGELTIIFHSSACVLGVHLGKLRHESLLFADDAVLLASMERDLQHTLELFAAKYETERMSVSSFKSVAIMFSEKW